MVEEALIVVEGGPHDGETIPLARGATLGRHTANEVVLDEVGVSRRHAEIEQSQGVYRLRDLNSTNGTFVNGERLTKSDLLLDDGDTVSLGTSAVRFKFYWPKAETLRINLAQQEGDAPTQTFAVSPAAASDVYKGTVRLRVEGSMGLVVQFNERLNIRPDLNVLRLANNSEGDTEIWLALRQPISLTEVIGNLKGVVRVSPPQGRDLSPEGKDPPLTVILEVPDMPPTKEWVPCLHCRELLEPGTVECPRCLKTQA